VKPLSHKPDHSDPAVPNLHNVVRSRRRLDQPEKGKTEGCFSKDEGFSWHQLRVKNPSSTRNCLYYGGGCGNEDPVRWQ
jgi:hypothetical protein